MQAPDGSRCILLRPIGQARHKEAFALVFIFREIGEICQKPDTRNGHVEGLCIALIKTGVVGDHGANELTQGTDPILSNCTISIDPFEQLFVVEQAIQSLDQDINASVRAVESHFNVVLNGLSALDSLRRDRATVPELESLCIEPPIPQAHGVEGCFFSEIAGRKLL